MVQRQIDSFFRKKTPQKSCGPSPYKTAQESQEKLSQDTSLFSQTSDVPLSCQRLLFQDSSAPTANSNNKRSFAYMMQQSPESNKSEQSIKNYFTVQAIKHSKSNGINMLMQGDDFFQDNQSSLYELIKNKKPKLNEDSNSIYSCIKQEKLDDSRNIFSHFYSSRMLDRNSESETRKILPHDLMLQVFRYLEMKELFVTLQVNKNWKSISQKCLKNYHSYFSDVSMKNLTIPHFNYLKQNSELTHIKYITKLFKNYQQTYKIFEFFHFEFRLSLEYNQSKPDKMFEKIIISSKVNTLKYVSTKTLKKMFEHSRNSIKTLCLRNIQMVPQVPQYIPSLRELEQLFLQNNYDIDDSIVQSISSRCKNLKVLQLSNCASLTDKSVECISSISNLQRLDLSSNYGLSFTNIHKLQNNKHLSSLCLKNTNFSNSNLDILFHSVHSLKRLNIDECKQLNFLTVKVIQTKMPKSIRILQVDKTNAFTEQQIFDIVEKNEGLLQVVTTSLCSSSRIVMKLMQNRLNLLFRNIGQGIKRSEQSAFSKLRQSTNWIELDD